ncbi:MAG: 6-phosphogluconolactonase [Anaerorhabdus sp.]
MKKVQVRIHRCKNYEEVSEEVGKELIETMMVNKHSNICLATGESPTLAYSYFVKSIKEKKIDTQYMNITKLDEWCNLEPTSPCTCESYIQTHVLKSLNIKEDKYISFLSNADNYENEVIRIQEELSTNPIDLCILGLGKNGHLGLNEPNEKLLPYAHVCDLSQTTKGHSMLQGNVVSSGMSIGIQEILNAKKIILMVCGKGKQGIFDEFLKQEINSYLPASFLWLHNNVDIYVDEEVFK